MKIPLIFFLFFNFLVSCSNDSDSDSEAPIGNELTERILGVWRQTKITFVEPDGSSRDSVNECITQTEIGFSEDGTYRQDEYEGNTIENCSLFIFEGTWRAETDPEDPANNFKIRTDRLDGENYFDDWDYGEVVFFGNKLLITYKFDDGSSTVYENIKI